jgi:hypothetical protein
LVVWNHGILWLSNILGIATRTDELIFFQRGRYTTKQKLVQANFGQWKLKINGIVIWTSICCTTDLCSHDVWSPFMGWMTINCRQCFDHGTWSL